MNLGIAYLPSNPRDGSASSQHANLYIFFEIEKFMEFYCK